MVKVFVAGGIALLILCIVIYIFCRPHYFLVDVDPETEYDPESRSDR